MTQFDKQALNRLAKISDPALIFTALDLDDDGELTVEEFCDGIWQVAISKVPLEMQRMEKQVSELHRCLVNRESMSSLVTELHADIRAMGSDVAELKSQFSVHAEFIQEVRVRADRGAGPRHSLVRSSSGEGSALARRSGGLPMLSLTREPSFGLKPDQMMGSLSE